MIGFIFNPEAGKLKEKKLKLSEVHSHKELHYKTGLQ